MMLLLAVLAASPQANAIELGRFRGGLSAYYQDSASYSAAPVAAWAPRLWLGESLYLGAELGATAVKTPQRTAAVALVSFGVGWERLLAGLRPEAGVSLQTWTGSGSGSFGASTVIAPKLGLYWGFAEGSVLSAAGARWSLGAGTLGEGQRGFVAFHQFDVVGEIRL